MKPLSNFDIEKMLKKIPGFRGVFASDDLPETPMLNESGVMNFDVLGNPGTHWVSWICRGGSRPFSVYFDSFGVPIPDTLRAYLNKHPGTHWANSGEIQSMDSVLCGYYCVDFIKACHDASSPMEVIDWLNEYKPGARAPLQRGEITNEEKLMRVLASAGSPIRALARDAAK